MSKPNYSRATTRLLGPKSALGLLGSKFTQPIHGLTSKNAIELKWIMKFFMRRFVALLLVPCLLTEPASASVFSIEFMHVQSHSQKTTVSSYAPFEEEALMLALVTPLHAFAAGPAEAVRKLAEEQIQQGIVAETSSAIPEPWNWIVLAIVFTLLIVARWLKHQSKPMAELLGQGFTLNHPTTQIILTYDPVTSPHAIFKDWKFGTGFVEQQKAKRSNLASILRHYSIPSNLVLENGFDGDVSQQRLRPYFPEGDRLRLVKRGQGHTTVAAVVWNRVPRSGPTALTFASHDPDNGLRSAMGLLNEDGKLIVFMANAAEEAEIIESVQLLRLPFRLIEIFHPQHKDPGALVIHKGTSSPFGVAMWSLLFSFLTIGSLAHAGVVHNTVTPEDLPLLLPLFGVIGVTILTENLSVRRLLEHLNGLLKGTEATQEAARVYQIRQVKEFLESAEMRSVSDEASEESFEFQQRIDQTLALKTVSTETKELLQGTRRGLNALARLAQDAFASHLRPGNNEPATTWRGFRYSLIQLQRLLARWTSALEMDMSRISKGESKDRLTRLFFIVSASLLSGAWASPSGNSSDLNLFSQIVIFGALATIFIISWMGIHSYDLLPKKKKEEEDEKKDKGKDKDKPKRKGPGNEKEEWDDIPLIPPGQNPPLIQPWVRRELLRSA
jgi:hypothetical protein